MKRLYVRMAAQRLPTHVYLDDPAYYYRKRVAEAYVPYEPGTRAALPDTDPFNISVQLAGDDGMILMSGISVLPDGRLGLFYNSIYELDSSGCLHIERTVGPEACVIDIKLLEDN